MAFKKLWVIAYRDLGRNRRRSGLTLLAVGLGLGIIIVLSGFIAGVLESSLRDSIRLQTGHLQLRAESYEPEKLSLLWADLVEEPQQRATAAQALPEVRAATPILLASGVLSTIAESTGVQLMGVDPASTVHDPVREGVREGAFLAPGDRGGILVGRRLARQMGLGVGQRVSLAAGNPEGLPDEGVFTVVGLYDTGFPSYDDSTVLMSLEQAQAFTRTGNRASSVRILLHDQEDTARVAAALQAEGLAVLTWEDLNAVILQSLAAGMSFYYILYGIVILVVAVIIANTLLMAVFERTREMGILAALGMKGRHIMLMFLLEAAILALLGIAVGLVLGSLGVTYLATRGIYIGEASASMVQGFTISTTMHGRFAPGAMAGLSLAMLLIILLVSLYPAWYAARLEPVEALRAL